MTLLDRVTASLDGDQSKALAGLRPLFMVIKLATPRNTFAKIAEGVPDADPWAREAALGDAGRTGELLALITPDTLAQRMKTVGLCDTEIDRLGQDVGGFLAETVDAGVAEEIAELIPIIRLINVQR